MKTISCLPSCASTFGGLSAPAAVTVRVAGSWQFPASLVSLCLGLFLLCGGIIQAQNISLGGATFAATSDQIPQESYWPMPANVTFTYDGFGKLEGATRAETYVGGQWVAGVKAVKSHVETRLSAASAVTAEDWWLALDADGSLRVLKIVQDGVTAFVASGETTPPVYIPATPVEGQTWSFLGNTITIEAVVASRSGAHFIKLAVAAPDSNVDTHQYNFGVGLVQDDSNEKTSQIRDGWSLRSN